jgi:hypothetical protein
MNKVCTVNLEQGHPTVEEALRRLKNGLSTAKMSGKRAVILIHGYGSGGTGGAIKGAVGRALGDPAFVGMVRDVVPGEAWESRKAAFVGVCPDLREQSRYLSGNQGVTIVLLR